MKKPVLISVVVLLLFFGQCSESFGQWRIIGSFAGGGISTIHFLDDVGAPNIGFASTTKNAYRTTDRGKTWTIMNIGANALDFAFRDSLNGWMACILLYRTTDGGVTWQQTSMGGDIHCIYYNKYTKRLFASRPLLTAMYSSDDGITWISEGAKAMLGYAFTDSATGIRTSFDSLYNYTTDGGVTWTESTFRSECWQPIAIPSKKMFIAPSETFIGTDIINKSTDGGMSWSPLFNFTSSGELTGTIRGDSTRLYVQSTEGIAVSTTVGKKWVSICGPGNGWDTRFFAKGDTVFAGDKFGNVWMTPRGGLGPYDSATYFTPSEIHLFSEDCSLEISGVKLTDSSNCRQDRLQILEAWLTGSSNFYFPIAIPDFLSNGQTIEVGYYPKQEKYDTAIFHIRYVKFDSIYEKEIPVYGERLPTLSYKITPMAISKTISSPCISIDTSIAIHNNRCDSLTITGARMMFGNSIEIVDPNFPVMIAPDEERTIQLHCLQSLSKGIYYDTLLVSIKKSGIEFIDTVAITIKVLNDITAKGQILPSRLNFGLVSLCSGTKKKSVSIRNIICRDFEVTGLSIQQNGAEFKLGSWVSHTLSPDMDDSIEIEFAPSVAGSYYGWLHFHILFNGNKVDTMISISATATASVAANIDDSLLNFGTISTCETIEKETYLENSSCDSIKLTNIIGLNSSDFIIKEPILPCWIQKGERKKILIEFKPSAAGSMSRFLQFFVGQTSSSLSLPLQLEAKAVSEPVNISLSTNSIIFDTITVCQQLDSSINFTNRMQCDSVYVDSIWTNSNPHITISPTSPFPDLAPNESNGFSLSLTPLSAETIADTIHIRLRSRNGIIDTSIFITAVITGDRQSIALSSTSFDFGMLSLCDRKDTTITISNTGCDTLWITDLALQGSGFDLADKTPFYLLNGEHRSVSIIVTPDSVAHKSNNTGVLTIQNSTGVLQTVGLKSQLQYPQTMGVYFQANNETLTPASVMRLKLKATTNNLVGLNTLDLVLNYNSDLMSFATTEGVNTITSIDGQHFHISGIPAILFQPDSSLATLVFSIYLTKDTMTTLSISDIHPNLETPQFEECTLKVNTSPATMGYVFECGEKFIREVLLDRQLSFMVTGISPIPADNELTVRIHSRLEQPATVEVCNALGVMVAKKETSLTTGENRIMIDLDDLPSGSYAIVVRTTRGSVSKVIIKER